MELAKISSNPYQLALESHKIAEMKKSDAVSVMIDILSKTYYDAGQVMPGYNVPEQTKNLQVLAGALHEETKQFGFLRIEELRIAFKNGVRGEYGEYFGLNIKTFYQWIKGFQMDDKRKNAILAAKAASEAEIKPVWSADKAEYEYKQTITRQFEAYKAGGPLIISFPIKQYQDLEQRGLVAYSNAEKLEFMEKAKVKFLAEAKIRRLNPKNKMELSELSKQIARIEEGNNNDSDKYKIKAAACELAIRSFYDSIQTLNL